MSLLLLVVLFCTGVLQDALSTKYMKVVQNNHIKASVILSIVITLIGCGVWMELLNQFLQQHYTAIVAYSLGGGFGTYLAMLRKKEHVETKTEEAESVCNCSASSIELIEVPSSEPAVVNHSHLH